MKILTNRTICSFISNLSNKNLSSKEAIFRINTSLSFINWLSSQKTISETDAIRFRSELHKAKHTYSSQKAPLSSLPLKYVGFSLAVLSLLLIGTGMYLRFFKNVKTPFAYSTAPLRAGRIISFQGRMTDSIGNPITAPIDVTYNFYSVPSGGSPLTGSTRVCTASPDQDGVFNTLIGNDTGPSCNTEIPSSIFTENTNVYLGVKIGTEVTEMTPRQQIANVGYAINSETLQGMPPGQGVSSIPFINSDGNMLIAAANPGLRSTFASANFTISSALSTTIQSAGNGDITLSASEGGALRFKTYYGTLDERMTILNNGNVGIGTTTPRALLDVNGNATVSGSLIAGGQIKIGEFTSPPTSLGNGSTYYDSNTNKIYYWNGTSWTDLASSSSQYWQRTLGSVAPTNITDALNLGAVATTSALVHLPGTNNQNAWFNLGTGNVGIGNTSPSQKLDIVGNILASGKQAVNGAAIDTNVGLNIGSTGNGQSAIATQLNLSGTSSTGYGLYNNFVTVPSNGGTPAGMYNTVADITNSGNFYGTYNTINTHSRGWAVGSYNTMNVYNAVAMGTYSHLHSQSSGSFMIGENLDIVTSAADTAYGVLAQIQGVSGATTYGLYVDNTTSTGGINYGIYTDGENMNYLSGNLGIGTSSPTSKLHVIGNANITGYATVSASLALGSSNATAGYGNLDMSGSLTLAGAIKPGGNAGTSGFLLTSSGGNVNTWTDPATLVSANGYWQRTTGSLAPMNITDAINVGAIASTSALVHLPGTNNQNAWFNLGTGNVGIGTTSPVEKLVVAVTGTTAGLKVEPDDYSSSVGAFYIRKSGDANSSFTFRRDGTLLWGAGGTSTLDTNLYRGTANILQTDDGFNIAGNVGIGTTSPGAKLQVNGDASSITSIFRANATTPGNITEWQNNSGTILANMSGSGKLYIGSTPSTTITSPLQLTGGGSFVSGMVLRNSSLTTPNYTGTWSNTLVDVNTFASIGEVSNGHGGSLFNGFSDSGSVNASFFNGVMGATSTSVPAIVFRAAKSDGSTGATSLASSETVAQFRNWTTNLVTILGSGNVGIGTTAPAAKLDILGNFNVSTYATVGASLALGSSNATSGYGNLDMSGSLTLAGAIMPGGNAGTSGYLLTSNGGGVNTWTDPATLGVGSSYWQETLGSLAPKNITDAINVGAIASTSALVHLPGTNNQNAWFNLGTGNVGIGTTNPLSKLEIVNPGSGGSLTDVIRLNSNSQTASTEQAIGFYDDANHPYSRISGGISNWGADKGYLAFSTRGSASPYIQERVRIDDLGNVGIGTTNPQETLDIRGGMLVTGVAGGIPSLPFARFGYAPYGGGYGFLQAYDGSTSQYTQLRIEGNPVTIATGTTTGGIAERLRVDANGNVGINTTTTTTGRLTVNNGTGETGFYVGSNASRTLPNIRSIGYSSNNADGGGGIELGDGTGNSVNMFITRRNDNNFSIQTSGGNTNDLYLQPKRNFLIDTTGNVGIGSTAPGAKLQIDTASKAEAIRLTAGGYMNFGGANDGAPSASDMSGAKLVFYQSAANSQSSYAIGEENNYMWLNSLGGYKWYEGSANPMILTNGGNLGIGTTDPSSFKLQVAGNVGPDTDLTYSLGSPSLRWNTIYANSIIGSSTGSLGYWQRNGQSLSPTNITDDIFTGGTATASALVKLPGTVNQNAWFNLGTGNVGIGTTGPREKLEVTGNIIAGVYYGATGYGTYYLNPSGISNLGSDLTVGGKLTVNGDATASGSLTIGSNKAIQAEYGSLYFDYKSGPNAWSHGMTLTSSTGRLGIGNINPDYALDVTGDIKLSGAVIAGSNGVGTSGYILTSSGGGVNTWTSPSGLGGLFQRTSGSLAPLNITDDINVGAIASTSALVHLPGTNNQNAYFNLGTGNVGIGTTGPTQRLDVVSTTNGPFDGLVVRPNNLSQTTSIGYNGISTSYSMILNSGGDGTYIHRFQEGGTDRMAILSGGYVGIGTTAPNTKLDIFQAPPGNGTISNYLTLNAQAAGAVAQDGIGIFFRHLSGGTYFQSQIASRVTAGGNGSDLTFGTARPSETASEKMRIMSDGNVGIGTTAPGAKLQVATGDIVVDSTYGLDTAAASGTLAIGNTNATTIYVGRTATSPSILIGRSSGTGSLDLAGGSGGVSIGSSGQINLISSLAAGNGTTETISLYAKDDLGSSDEILQIGDSGTTAFMTLMGDGKLGIGGNTSPGALLDIGIAGTTRGTMRLEGNTSGYVQIQPGAAAGSWTMTLPLDDGTSGQQLQTDGNGVTSWQAAGSLRSMKQNIVPITSPSNALSQILSTPIYHFNYKPGMGTGDSATDYVGVMADEAQWAMHFNGTIVNPVNTLGYMVLGIQGLNNKIDGLSVSSAGDITLNGNPIDGYTVATSNGTVSRIEALAKAVVANIQAGAIQTTELASNFITATEIATNKLTANIINTQKIVSPLAEIDTLKTNEIKPTNNDLVINLSHPEQSEGSGGQLAQLVIKGLNNTPVVNIDAAGNATFAGTLAAQSVESQKLKAQSLETENASVSGTLIAKNIQSENIGAMESQSTQFANDINAVQQELAALKNQPLPNPAYYQNIDASYNNLTVNDTANLYKAHIADSLVVGTLFVQPTSILALSDDLHISSLGTIRLFDDAVVIAKNGDITIKGGVSATSLAIKNVDGVIVASIDASGSARFNEVIAKKFTLDTIATQGAFIADSGVMNEANVPIPAIKTNTEVAGIGTLPQDTKELIIYNDNVTADSLIYLTPTSQNMQGQLSVTKKVSCPTNSTCTPYFVVSSSIDIHSPSSFNWLIIN